MAFLGILLGWSASASAFEVFGFDAGMTIDTVRKVAPLLGFEELPRPHAARDDTIMLRPQRRWRADVPDNVVLQFCSGRLYAVSLPLGEELSPFASKARERANRFGNPTITTAVGPEAAVLNLEWRVNGWVEMLSIVQWPGGGNPVTGTEKYQAEERICGRTKVMSQAVV